MPSRVISSFTYDPQARRLVVTFVTGRVYEYFGVPAEVAAKYCVMPVGFDHGRLILAVADPMDFQAMDSLPHVLSTYPLEFYCAQRSQIEQFITDVYGIAKEQEADRVVGGGDSERSEASEDDAPIVRLVMDMLAEAVTSRASAPTTP